jgi:Transposase
MRPSGKTAPSSASTGTGRCCGWPAATGGDRKWTKRQDGLQAPAGRPKSMTSGLPMRTASGLAKGPSNIAARGSHKCAAGSWLQAAAGLKISMLRLRFRAAQPSRRSSIAGSRSTPSNPKQLDRFRDRFSPAGAKDDSRDAETLSSSLRTGRRAFHQVALADPAIIELREWSRMPDFIGTELKYEKAAGCLKKDRGTLLAYYDFLRAPLRRCGIGRSAQRAASQIRPLSPWSSNLSRAPRKAGTGSMVITSCQRSSGV